MTAKDSTGRVREHTMSTDIFARKPVSRQAARAIWKAPWWAHLNEVNQQAKRVIPAHEWTLFADLFAPPPEANSIDRRGLHVKFFNGNRGVITGFHRRKKTGGNNHYYWWVILEDGHITTIRWASVGANSRRFELVS